jgi:flagellar hook-length control protein FliK
MQVQISEHGLLSPVPTSMDTALVMDTQIAPLDDPGIGLSSASASTSATTSTAPAAVASPPAQAQSAAQQIAAALAAPDQPRHGDHPIEIALDPPELGRVRLTLTEVNGALTLTIVADRPDTVDLMRRHLDLLAQEFARAGLGGPSVNLSQNGGGGADRGNASAANAPPADTVIDPAAIIPARKGDGGLDLRL